MVHLRSLSMNQNSRLLTRTMYNKIPFIFQNTEEKDIKLSILEFLEPSAYIEYFKILRDSDRFEFFENKYYNEEAATHQWGQNILGFSIRPEVIKNQKSVTLRAKFDILHRIRQLNHKKADLDDVFIPLFTKIYTNAISLEKQKEFFFDTNCLFQNFGEVYIGTFMKEGEVEKRIDFIIPNSEFYDVCEKSTVGVVALGLLFALITILKAPKVEELSTGTSKKLKAL